MCWCCRYLFLWIIIELLSRFFNVPVEGTASIHFNSTRQSGNENRLLLKHTHQNGILLFNSSIPMYLVKMIPSLQTFKKRIKSSILDGYYRWGVPREQFLREINLWFKRRSHVLWVNESWVSETHSQYSNNLLIKPKPSFQWLGLSTLWNFSFHFMG